MKEGFMDIMLVIALIVGAAVCFLPVIMAWSYNFGGRKKEAQKAATLKEMKPAHHHTY
jgi:hypothetical protein